MFFIYMVKYRIRVKGLGSLILGRYHGSAGVYLVTWGFLGCESGVLEGSGREAGRDRLCGMVEGVFQESEGLLLQDKVILDIFKGLSWTKGWKWNSHKSWSDSRKTISLLK